MSKFVKIQEYLYRKSLISRISDVFRHQRDEFYYFVVIVDETWINVEFKTKEEAEEFKKTLLEELEED